MGQHRLDRTYSRAPARGGRSSGLRELCGSIAGSQDGRHTRGSAWLPARARRQGEAVCGTRHGRARAIRPHRTGIDRSRRVGPRLRLGKAAAVTIQLLGPGGEAVFSGGHCSRGDVSGGADHFRRRHPCLHGPSVACDRALFRRDGSRGRPRRTVLSRPLCAAGEARRRLDG